MYENMKSYENKPTIVSLIDHKIISVLEGGAFHP